MKSAMKRQVRRGGFTLLEVLLVLAILGVIAAIVVPSLLGRQQEAMVRTTRSSIAGLETAMQAYAIDHNGMYPEGGLEHMQTALMQPKDADGNALKPYLDSIPKDAWAKPLNYRYPGTKQPTGVDKPDIWSNGQDGKNDDGSGDDVNNWTETSR
ncbi:MAG: type II secretion system major pseudopilin GspG [Planctomycetota bacterium]|nr:type II secretion system major pseudopilin GspG [Planctomycetaceae bacterium]MDQ3329035.1 type II secretion system major pseudopilin GspG [Planctomycetota bacterium]